LFKLLLIINALNTQHDPINAKRTLKQNKAAAAILKDYLFQKKMDIEFEELKVLCFLF
jgi:hypothetical protein